MKKLTKEIIKKCEENPNGVDWKKLVKIYNLPESFIERFKDKVDWTFISTYQKLSETFIEKYKNKVDWWDISRYQKLSEPFIEKYKNDIEWYALYCNQNLANFYLFDSFIKKFKNKIDWNGISEGQKLSESFIEKHKNDINWFYISCCQKLSESFIEKHKNDINWKGILLNQKIPDYLRNKYQYKTFEDLDSNTNSSEKIKNKITDDEKFVAGVCKVDDSKVILTGKTHYIPEYKKIIENVDKKTVVVLWSDNTVTTAHCSEEDVYDFGIGLSLCFSKKMFDNFHNFALYAKHKAEKNGKTKYRK